MYLPVGISIQTGPLLAWLIEHALPAAAFKFQPCLLAGWLCSCCRRYKTQQFNSVASQTSGSLLLLAAISILIPTAAQQLGTGGGPAEAALDALVGAPMAADKVRSAVLRLAAC
jgi:hypothetical protein